MSGKRETEGSDQTRFAGLPNHLLGSNRHLKLVDLTFAARWPASRPNLRIHMLRCPTPTSLQLHPTDSCLARRAAVSARLGSARPWRPRTLPPGLRGSPPLVAVAAQRSPVRLTTARSSTETAARGKQAWMRGGVARAEGKSGADTKERSKWSENRRGRRACRLFWPQNQTPSFLCVAGPGWAKRAAASPIGAAQRRPRPRVGRNSSAARGASKIGRKRRKAAGQCSMFAPQHSFMATRLTRVLITVSHLSTVALCLLVSVTRANRGGCGAGCATRVDGTAPKFTRER